MNYSVVLPVLTGAAEREKGWRLRRNPKRAGEISEAAFVVRAHSLGFLVAKPWGDSEKYDFVLDAGSKLWRGEGKKTEGGDERGGGNQPIFIGYGGGGGGGEEGGVGGGGGGGESCGGWGVGWGEGG